MDIEVNLLDEEIDVSVVSEDIELDFGDGMDGAPGWSPVFAIEADGARRVLKVVDWIGSWGTMPDVDVYVGLTGFVTDIADAVDIRGPAGGVAADDFEIYPAGENLSSGRVVIIEGGEAFYFQPANDSHYGRAFGFTKTSASIGNDVSIQRSGSISDAAFNAFTDEVLYVGTDGELQTTWNAGEIAQKAAIAVESGKVKIDFSIQIQLI